MKGFRDFVVISLFSWIHVLAYVPAHPTNSSQEAIAGGLNVSDISKLHLRWYSKNYYSQNVSYQLAGYGSQGISKGALVHFSETKVSNDTLPTATPWIAMISCDSNATSASQDEDVFTLARDKGAVAALLYSSNSLACVINPEYANPETFDQVFDIFSTQSLTSATLIEYQFGQFGPVNESFYGVYDSKRLNDSAAMMDTTLQVGTPPEPGYLFAILQAYNSTGQIDDASGNIGSADPGPPHRKQNTALAMIVLYAITGCVSALFCVVIISGAIRAIRHPERYGPRALNGRGGTGQSRAQGITRAILDTFPVVKFGSNAATPEPRSRLRPAKDVEAQSHASSLAVELKDWEVVHIGSQDTVQQEPSTANNPAIVENVDTDELRLQGFPQSPRCSHSQSGAPDFLTHSAGLGVGLGEGSSRGTERNRDDVIPASMGRETCPICIMDFEEGDDLRVLPCEGKHRFHQSCVDPWLLELSSSCPICREDFLALENIIAGESELGHNEDSEAEGRITRTESPSNIGNRFSRYLRFAKRRHHPRFEDDIDPTDPHMPTAP
ncbi:hypothetical protein FPV67DRAFT_1413367 [Lyophyllum atratum]|nr:hypothetical protein FPV67DRAFT_1413367 [Lyophyllum atratum]